VRLLPLDNDVTVRSPRAWLPGSLQVETSGGEMPSSPDAAEKIRQKLAAGMLPPPDARGIMFTGYGAGRLCDGCDTPILAGEMEYEAEAPDRRTIRFHVRCVLLWQMYGQRRGGSEPAK